MLTNKEMEALVIERLRKRVRELGVNRVAEWGEMSRSSLHGVMDEGSNPTLRQLIRVGSCVGLKIGWEEMEGGKDAGSG